MSPKQESVLQVTAPQSIISKAPVEMQIAPQRLASFKAMGLSLADQPPQPVHVDARDARAYVNAKGQPMAENQCIWHETSLSATPCFVYKWAHMVGFMGS